MPFLCGLLALACGEPPPPGLRFPDAEAAEKAPAEKLPAADAKRLAAKQHATAGLAHWQNQRLAKAMQEFRLALQANPVLLPTLRDAAKLAQELERNDEALGYAVRALALDGGDPEMLVAAGRLHLAAGNAELARPHLEAANQLPQLAETDVGLYVETRELLAELYGRTNYHAGAAAALRALLDVVEHPERFGLNEGGGRQLAGSRPGLALRLVAALRRSGQSAEALKAIAEFGADDPALARLLREQRAEVELDRGEFAAARKTLDQALAETAPSSAAALALLKRAYEKDGPAPYDAKLEALRKTYPRNELVRNELAQRRLERGDLDGAKEALGDGGNAESAALLLRIAAQRNRPEAAYDALAQLIELLQTERRRDFGGRQAPGVDLDKLTEDLSANQAFAAGLAKRAMAVPAPDRGDNVQQAAATVAADIAYKGGAYREAAPLFQRCLGFGLGEQADWTAQRMLRCHLLCDQPQALLDAAAKLPAGLAGKPSVIGLRATALAKLQQFAAGEKLLKDELAKQGGADEVRVALGDFYRQERKFDEALVALKPVAEGPDRQQSLLARYEIAGIHSVRKRDDLAEAELLQIIAANGGGMPRLLAAANNDLGYLWADAGKNLDRAESMVREALKSDPDNLSYVDSLGWALFKRGKVKEAVVLLKRAATSKGTSDATLWDHYGDALLKSGDRPGAAAAWRKAVEICGQPAHRAADADKAEPIQRKLDALGRLDAAPGSSAGK